MEGIMEKEFHELKNKVDDIHRMLLGSEHEQEVGLLHRLKENEKSIKALFEWREKVTWFAYGMTIPATYGMFDIIKAIIQRIG